LSAVAASEFLFVVKGATGFRVDALRGKSKFQINAGAAARTVDELIPFDDWVLQEVAIDQLQSFAI